MNTRLQVEHPITELVTGVDLVRAQVHVAEGHPLPWRQEDLTARGHAIECRICAEDPANGFLPSLGGILLMHEPTGPGVRLDSGVRAGDEVSMHYDPLLAKLCVVAEDRPAAIDRTLQALREFAILGVTTNVAYLADVLRDEVFASGDLDTGFLGERFAGWTGDASGDHDLALAVAAVAENGGITRSASDVTADAPGHATPWNTLGRFRLHGLD
jgi:acetyl/propionyl-CoA carboxylase alpha subunit